MGLDRTYYTITDEAFFVGTAALLNSLRLTGNTDELVVLDCGLAERQRNRLVAHCRVVPAPRVSSSTGIPIKPFALPEDASGIVVLIDSDMLVTGSLDPLLADAAQGGIAMFVDQLAELTDQPKGAFPSGRVCSG